MRYTILLLLALVLLMGCTASEANWSDEPVGMGHGASVAPEPSIQPGATETPLSVVAPVLPVSVATPELTPALTPIVAFGVDNSTEVGIEAAICSYPWDCGVALCIAYRESTFNPAVVNPVSGTVGLMQIRPSVHAWRWEQRGWSYEDMMTVGPNLEIAWELYQEQGWRPWDGSPGCWS
jgi:hypothetical protein